MYKGQQRLIKNMGIAVNFWLLLIVLLMGYSASSFATITQIQDSKKCSDPCWEVTGEISKSDLQELARAVKIMSGTKAMPTFRLNSNGGDLEVAIAIGRQLRRFHATAITWNQGGCYSSCVFILAGAVQRMLSTTIGIHRPYSSSTDLRDFQTIQNDQRRLAKFAKNYLVEVNVFPSLFGAMVSIPPERIKLLSEAELEQYGILAVDPSQQELWDTADAKKRGITKVEFMRRKAQIAVICSAEYENATHYDQGDDNLTPHFDQSPFEHNLELATAAFVSSRPDLPTVPAVPGTASAMQMAVQEFRDGIHTEVVRTMVVEDKIPLAKKYMAEYGPQMNPAVKNSLQELIKHADIRNTSVDRKESPLMSTKCSEDVLSGRR